MFFASLLKFVTPSARYEADSIALINDVYKEGSIKDGTRDDRGISGPRTFLEGIDQRMLTGTKWDEFLHNKENKTDLISLLFRVFKISGEGILFLGLY